MLSYKSHPTQALYQKGRGRGLGVPCPSAEKCFVPDDVVENQHADNTRQTGFQLVLFIQLYLHIFSVDPAPHYHLGQNNSALSPCAPTPKSSFGETRLVAVHCSHYLGKRALVSVYKFSFILQKYNDAVTLYYANIVKKAFGTV